MAFSILKKIKFSDPGGNEGEEEFNEPLEINGSPQRFFAQKNKRMMQ